MHVPGERGRPAKAAELRGGQAIGLEIGAETALLLRDADREQAFRMHVAEVLDRESGLTIVFLRARRQHAAAECPRPSDQLGLGIAQAERFRRKDRGVAIV